MNAVIAFAGLALLASVLMMVRAWVFVGDPTAGLCKCSAFHPAVTASWHFESEHRYDCKPYAYGDYCGGCTSCIGMQAHYYASLKG